MSDDNLSDISKGITKGILETVLENSKGLFNWANEQKLNILPLNFNVALAIEFEKGSVSDKYYKQLLKELNKLIDGYNLSQYIKLQEIPHLFKNKTEAEKFRSKKELDLLIWGSFSIDGLKSKGEDINKLDINFTFGYPDNKLKQVGPLILKDITSRFYIYNYWKINKDDSLKDIELISSNSFDISIYIIALTLKLWGRLGESIILFEKLYSLLEHKNIILRQQMIPHLINCYEQYVLFLVLEKKEIENGAKVCEKILTLNKDNFFALLNLARWHFEEGRVKESYEMVEKLLVLYPRNPAVELDIGFHKILKKEYKNGFKHYQRLVIYGKNQVNFNPIEVIAFLDEQYYELKDPAILYVLGLISYYYGDIGIAKQNLNSFLQLTTENFCKEMYRDAKKILIKIANATES